LQASALPNVFSKDGTDGRARNPLGQPRFCFAGERAGRGNGNALRDQSESMRNMRKRRPQWAVRPDVVEWSGRIMGESTQRLRLVDATHAMVRYAAGDESAFAEVYEAIAPRLYAWLVRRTRDGAWAEDLLQQTLLRIHRARSTFISGNDVLPWAFAIAQRLMFDDLRRKQRDMSSETEDLAVAAAPFVDGAEAECAANELALRMQSAFERLPRTQQQAFELVRLDGLSHSQAAEAVGSTVSAIKLRAHRASVALRAVLTESDGDAALRTNARIRRAS
jgi:RNA polymerase sigma-70 factor (ECF subfamily)